MPSEYTEQEHLVNQYGKSPNKLKARTNLYQTYRARGPSWHDWLYDRLKLSEEMQPIADIGCGTGSLWLCQKTLRTQEAPVLLVDSAQPMIDACRTAFPKNRGYTVVKSEALEFLRAHQVTFGTLIASHVLYHIPDPNAFVKLSYECLLPNGRLCITTVARDHLATLRELAMEMESALGLNDMPEWSDLPFSDTYELEELLSPHFTSFHAESYKSLLEVTDDGEAALDYLASLPRYEIEFADQAIKDEARKWLAENISRLGACLESSNWLAICSN